MHRVSADFAANELSEDNQRYSRIMYEEVED